MSESAPSNRLTVIKFMELLLSIGCTVLHYYSFGDRDIITAFLATGTFCGYIAILVAIFAGVLMKAPLSKRLDIFLSIIGSAAFVTSGVFIIQEWDTSFRTRTRDLAILKGSVAIINGVIFGLDALFTFRDK